MTSSIVWERAKKLCLSYKKQFVGKQGTHDHLPRSRTYAKMDLEDVFYLLDTVAYSGRAGMIELKQKLISRPWHLRATVHEGGFGSDEELHFNIEFMPPAHAPNTRKEHYHVRCKAKPDNTVYVFDVSSNA